MLKRKCSLAWMGFRKRPPRRRPKRSGIPPPTIYDPYLNFAHPKKNCLLFIQWSTIYDGPKTISQTQLRRRYRHKNDFVLQAEAYAFGVWAFFWNLKNKTRSIGEGKKVLASIWKHDPSLVTPRTLGRLMRNLEVEGWAKKDGRMEENIYGVPHCI